jgi:hypothetical protein
MEPILGLILFLVLSGLAAAIAWKKGLSGTTYFMGCLAGGFVMALVSAIASGGNGTTMAWAVFMVPIAVIFIAAFARTAAQRVADGGVFNGYRQCPYCAESVKAEAVKCKHCGSDIGSEAHVD